MSSEFGVTPADETDPNSTLTRDASRNPDETPIAPATDDTGQISDDDAAPSEDASQTSDSSSVEDASTAVMDGGVADTGVQDSGVIPLTAMISVPRPGGGAAFSIETREVTQKQYQAFLVSKAGDVSGQAAPCTSNSSYLPSQNWDPTTTPNRPVVGVDWCDARAYCAWAGRHLCGGFAGASLSTIALASDTTKSEWAIACTKGGTQTFPYSASTNNDTACNVLKPLTSHADDVATYPKCIGGYTGLYDMVGNASEWVDACDSSGNCAIMGGSWHAGLSPVQCSLTFGGARTSSFDDLGFRCCKD